MGPGYTRCTAAVPGRPNSVYSYHVPRGNISVTLHGAAAVTTRNAPRQKESAIGPVKTTARPNSVEDDANLSPAHHRNHRRHGMSPLLAEPPTGRSLNRMSAVYAPLPGRKTADTSEHRSDFAVRPNGTLCCATIDILSMFTIV